MNFPTNVKYTNEHEWIRLEGDEAYVGITDYAQEQLGDIVFVDVTTEGETLEKGEVFGTIEVVKTVSDLFLPIGGEVLEINPELEEHPELVKAFLTAQKQVLDEMDADHAAAVSATAKATGLEEAAVEEMYGLYDFDMEIKESDIEAMEKTEKFMEDTGMIENPVDVASLILDVE